MNNYLKMSFLALWLGVSSYALAAPTGPYVLIGGGANYLPKSALKSTTITSQTTGPETTFKITQEQKGKFGYTGRVAAGYFFNSDPLSPHAFGVEAGYNHFGSIQSTIHNQLVVPIAPGIVPNAIFPETTQEKTTAWAGDLEAVYLQDLAIPHTALLLKLGVGYEQMKNSITNVTEGIANQLPPSQTINNKGFGVAGGVGRSEERRVG